MMFERDVEEIMEILERDMKLMDELKRENRKLREMNEELREELSRMAKEMKDLKEDAEDYSYEFDHGWGSGVDHTAEEVEEIDPDQVEEQKLKISKLLEEVSDG